MTPKAQATTEKINWTSSNFNFYAPKNTIKKVKRDIQAHEKMLNIRQIQIKTTMRYHLTPVRMAIIKKKTISIGEDVEKKGNVMHCW